MKKYVYACILIFGLNACSALEDTPPKVNLGFTKAELTNLVMVTQGFLDGHLESTGQLKEGATMLMFEDGFVYAIGKTSPENNQIKHSRYSWTLNDLGQVVMIDIPDDPDFSPEPDTCTLTKTKEYKREFTAAGLIEKIDTLFVCEDFPENLQYKQTFRLPLPLYPRTLFGQTTYWSFSPETTRATFQADHTVKRQDLDDPSSFTFDPYEVGNYQNSLTITRTAIVHTDEGESTETTAMRRLFLFQHAVPAQGIMLALSYSPIIYMPPTQNGYAEATTDRYELHSIIRIKSLVHNPMAGNYEDRPTETSRSVNANLPPLKSAIVFK